MVEVLHVYGTFFFLCFFLYFKTFTKTDVYITVDAFIILTLERGRSKKRKNASIINIILVQVNNFQKVCFVPHFIKEFERKFYRTAELSYRISFQILWWNGEQKRFSENYWPVCNVVVHQRGARGYTVWHFISFIFMIKKPKYVFKTYYCHMDSFLSWRRRWVWNVGKSISTKIINATLWNGAITEISLVLAHKFSHCPWKSTTHFCPGLILKYF